MAAIIWVPGTPVNTAVVDSLMSSAPNPGDSERYFQCADRMMAAIRGGGEPQRQPGPGYPDEMMPSSSFLQDHSFHETDREDKKQMRIRKGRMQEKCGEFWKNVDQEPGPSQPKRMCPSRGSLERAERREAREGTDDSESRRVRYVREASSSVASNIVEDVRNAKAVVDKYFSKVTRCFHTDSDKTVHFSQGCGQLSLVSSGGKRTQQVLFHHSQAWAPPTKTQGHAPLLESHTGAEAEEMLQVIRVIMIVRVIMTVTRGGGECQSQRQKDQWMRRPQPPGHCRLVPQGKKVFYS